MKGNVSTEFRYSGAAHISTVTVVGSWDGWKHQTPMKSDGERGVWQAKKELPVGIVSFKFVVDGQWTTSRDYGVQDDGFGGVNNTMEVVMEVVPGQGGKKGGTDQVSENRNVGTREASIKSASSKENEEPPTAEIRKREASIESWSSKENEEPPTTKDAERKVQFMGNGSEMQEDAGKHTQAREGGKEGGAKKYACVVC